MKYCSRECQVGDWKNGHKQSCGVCLVDPDLMRACDIGDYTEIASILNGNRVEVNKCIMMDSHHY